MPVDSVRPVQLWEQSNGNLILRIGNRVVHLPTIDMWAHTERDMRFMEKFFMALRRLDQSLHRGDDDVVSGIDWGSLPEPVYREELYHDWRARMRFQRGPRLVRTLKEE